MQGIESRQNWRALALLHGHVLSKWFTNNERFVHSNIFSPLHAGSHRYARLAVRLRIFFVPDTVEFTGVVKLNGATLALHGKSSVSFQKSRQRTSPIECKLSSLCLLNIATKRIIDY